MKHAWILVLTLTMIFCIAGCHTSSIGSAGTQSTTTLPKPTSTVPTTTAVPTVPSTTQATTPPATAAPTAPQPTVSETCPPVEGDIYWGDFCAKAFEHTERDMVWRIILYADGTCEFATSVFSSYPPTVSWIWTFDGEYLYLGDIESGSYCTFLYVDAEDPYESKLIYAKTDCETSPFYGVPDGQVFNFSGIKWWE